MLSAITRRVGMGTRKTQAATPLSADNAAGTTSTAGNAATLDETSQLREANVKLRTIIEADQNQMKQLRRERAVEVKEVVEREQNIARIALKDLKLKLMQEKSAELERQKETLNKKFEAESAKLTRQKEAEVNKIRDALAKCQSKLSQKSENGLSGARARVNSFEGERAKLSRDLQEMRAAKKELEQELKSAEQQHRNDLARANQGHTAETARIKRDNEYEVRKLVEDIKARDRQMAALERDLQTQVAETARLRTERETLQHALKDAERANRKPAPTSPGSATGVILADGSESLDNPPGENSHDRSEAVVRRQLTDMTSQMHRLEEQCGTLKQEKADLVRKVAEVEKRQRPLVDRARRFLEKNVELTAMTRTLEERIKGLVEDNTKLKDEITRDQKEAEVLTNKLDEQKTEQQELTDVKAQLEQLREQLNNTDTNMEALKLACSEKDRRIELICHRRRKQRAVKQQQKSVRFLLVPNGAVLAAGIKETYYGFDDDRSSVDSEMSTSSRLSSSRLSLDNTFDEDDMFDEFTREEFLRNYQRLAKEHLELEKSSALLHTQAALSHVDPQRELKLRSQLENDLLSAQSRIEDLMKIVQENGQRKEVQDVSWLDEKELLNNSIAALKEKITQQEVAVTNLKVALQDNQEQSEELEFRCLELEELNKKLSEDVKQTLTFTGPVTLSDDGVLELYAVEEGLIDVRLEDLKTRLQELTELQNGHFSRDEQVVLLQTYALLNIADQKLKEHQTSEAEFKAKLDEFEVETKAKLDVLEVEKTTLREAGVTKDQENATIYNEIKAKLEASESRVTELTTEVEELRRSDAIHKYTEDFNQKAEERYKGEISVLRRQLSTSQEGRDYEKELLDGKLTQLKVLEQRVSELETENKTLSGTLEEETVRATRLQEQLTMEQDTQELTESDKDTSTLLHNLRAKLSQHEKSEHELSEKNEKLAADVVTLRERLAEYEHIEAELTERTFTLQQDAQLSKNKQKTLEDDLKTTQDELKSYKSQISVGSTRSRGSREDLISMNSNGSVGSMSEADLSEDNQSMRMELFSLREQLKSSEQEVERVRRTSGSGGDVQWKIKSLEKEIMDLKHENVTLKERLREKMKELDTVEEELGASIHDKKSKIKSLEEDMEQSRTEAASMETMIVEMKKEMFSMQEKLDVLEGGVKEKELLQLRTKNKDLEEAEEMAREELEAMNASHAVLKDNAESLLRREEEYDKQITALHQQLKANSNLIADLEVSQETLTEEKSELQSQLDNVLKSASAPAITMNSAPADRVALEEFIQKLKEDLALKEKELQVRDQLEMALKEKDNRIKFLQDQLERMEESEGRLNESLGDVEQLEGQLREQLLQTQGDTQEKTTSSGGSVYELELTQLRLTEAKLLQRIDELEEVERSLSDQLNSTKTIEGKEDAEEETMSEDNAKYKKRCRSLEARVNELAGHESDLMEQIYAMQLENQELQEHIDLLQEPSDHEDDEEESSHKHHTISHTAVKTVTVTAAAPAEKVVTKVAELEEANEALKQELLKVKLDGIATTTDADNLPDATKVTELKSKLVELEKREEEFIAQIETIQALEKKIAQLEEHRSELESELEEHATAERKLQQKIEILEQSEDKLMEELDGIAQSEGHLKKEVETLKLLNFSGQQNLLDKIRALEDQEKDLKDEVTDLQKRRNTLAEKLDGARQSEHTEIQRLQGKVDLLLDTEEKLIDRLQEQEVVEAELQAKLSGKEMEIEKLNEQLSTNLREIDHLKPLSAKLAEAELDIANLKDKLETLGEYTAENQKLKQDLQKKEILMVELESKISTTEKDRLQQLEKVNVFEEEVVKLITKLKNAQREVDELTEKQDVSKEETKKLQNKLKTMEGIEESRDAMENVKDQYSQQINELEEEITQLYEKTTFKEKEIVQLQQKLSKMESLNNALVESENEKVAAATTTATTIRELEETNTSLKCRVNDLDDNEKLLKDMVNNLEKSEAVLLTKIENLEKTHSDLRMVEESLRQQVGDYQHNERALNARLVTLEKEEIKLQTKVSDLEVHNTSLMSTITQTKSELLQHAPSPRRLSPRPYSRTPSPSRWDDLTQLELLDRMSHEELISKVHELENMERFHRSRIHELSDNMSQFRQAVETATVSMETDTNVPVSLRSQTKDTEYETKVTNMVRTEVNLKIKILHLQRQDSLLRSELTTVEEQMHDMEQNFRTEIEDLEEELDEARKAEAKWKNKTQYGQLGQENQALAKIQHLEDLVFDLEASERKLQHQVNVAQQSEDRLREKLKYMEEASKNPFEIPVNENDKYYDIIQQVMLLDASGKELSEKITKIEKDDTALLRRKVADLERSEKGLIHKVQLLENQDAPKVTFASLEGTMDTPEAILKKRVGELEKMEQHQKKQIIELERDREELHELSRTDKGNIHELSVQVRELEMTEKNLKDQINRNEADEGRLRLMIDDLNDRIQEFQRTVQMLQNSEKQLKLALEEHRSGKNELSLQLQNISEDWQRDELRFKKKVADLEGEKRALTERIDELTDRIGDLEGVEIAMKSKVKILENAEMELKSNTIELEHSESDAKIRAMELETCNETLSQKLHSLQEEKSGIMLDVSDLQVNKDSLDQEVQQLKSKLATMKARVADSEKSENELVRKIEDQAEHEMSLLSQIAEHKRMEASSQECIKGLEDNESKLRLTVQQLEGSVSMLNSRVQSNQDIEKENALLLDELKKVRITNDMLNQEKREVAEQLTIYQTAHNNNDMATLPSQELVTLRAQVKLLVEMEKNISELEKSEKNLKTTVRKLREGKDACGHEMEIKELKEELNTLDSVVKAHELLKENHEATKQELNQLLNQVKSGSKNLKAETATSSRAVQARLGQTYKLKDVSPELRMALKGLGAKYPDAYQDFVRTLQPSQMAHTVRQQKSASAMDSMITPTSGTSLHMPPPTSSTTMSGISKVSVTSEDPLWETIERCGAASVFSPGTDQEESYWANIENTSNDIDDMTLCLTFAEETDAMSRSTSSVHSDGSIPPLPSTLPPSAQRQRSPGVDSYYLPSMHADDSADEASDIIDDDDTGYLAKRCAKSAERETDLSEMLPLGASPQQRRHRRNKLGANTASLDSIPDSGVGTLRQSDADFLRERIASLEKQLKTREKELEATCINQREIERKVKDADEAATLTVKLTDYERLLEVERHRVADLRVELSEVQLQLTNRETDIKHLRADVDRLRNSLKAAPSSTDAESDETSETYLKTQLERKDKEISAKSNEVDHLIQELRKLQDESRSAQDECQGALAELSSAQLELQESRAVSEQLSQLTTEQHALKKEYDDLVVRHEQFALANEEKSALEKIVLKLRGQLKDLERIDLERQNLETKAKGLESELKLTRDTESELTRENAKMRHKIDQLTQENEHMNATHVTYDKVIAKYENMEQIKNKAQLMVTPLRAKTIKLAQKCKDKDNLIERLATELGRSGEPSDLLAETDRARAMAVSEEYNRPATPLPAEIFEDQETVISIQQSGTTFSQKQRLRTTSAGSSAGSSGADSVLDDDHGYHDNDEDVSKPRRSSSSKRGKADGKVSRHQHTDLIHNNGGFTIDDLVVAPSSDVSLQPVTLLGSHDVSGTSTWPRKKAGHGPTPPTVYRAVKDYDPEYFSQSGQKHLELPLNEGQHVRLLGALDQHGYYEAEVEGKTGLVPANYLEPVRDSHRKHHTLHTKMTTQNGSPEQILALHSQLQHSHIPHHNVLPPNKTGRHHMTTIMHPAFVRRPTVPPVHRATTMPRQRPVSAKHPGYTSRLPMAPPTTQSQNHDGLLMTAPMRRSLPALPSRPRVPGGGAAPQVGVQGAPSMETTRRPVRPVTVRAPPEPPTNFRLERVVGDNAVLLAWQPPQMDEMARSNGAVVKGYTIYINNRDKQWIPSPHMPKALIERLNLRRANRFSIQSVSEGGQKSRVVDVLFEDVLPPSVIGQGELAGCDGDVSVLSNRDQRDDGQRRVFMAVYDYNPSEHSPHDCPSDELNFCAGELISVYGSVNAEGFYQAKLQGRRGLVPASFIEEVSLLRSHSKRSLTTSNSQSGSRPHSQPNSQTNSRPNSIHGSLAKVAATPVS